MRFKIAKVLLGLLVYEAWPFKGQVAVAVTVAIRLF
jgi:hypothetical protein